MMVDDIVQKQKGYTTETSMPGKAVSMLIVQIKITNQSQKS